MSKIRDKMKATIISKEENEVLIAWSESFEYGLLKIKYSSNGCYMIDSEHITLDRILRIMKATFDTMPDELTFENGARELLDGKFADCFDPDNSGNPYIVEISWKMIKRIYNKIVSHYKTLKI